MSEQRHNLVQIHELVAGYVPGVDILRGTSIHVGHGEMVGIIGPNGAGKSTLIKAIFGLVPVRSGVMELEGTDIVGTAGFDLVRSRASATCHRSATSSAASASSENLRMGVFLRPERFEARRDQIFELFPVLADKRNDRAESLSGGQRQVLAMGRALMMEPSLMLLDEPSAGLSPGDAGRGVRADRRDQRGGRVDPDRRAERPQGAAHLRPGLRAGPGSRRLHRHRRRAASHDPMVIELYLGSLARQR